MEKTLLLQYNVPGKVVYCIKIYTDKGESIIETARMQALGNLIMTLSDEVKSSTRQ